MNSTFCKSASHLIALAYERFPYSVIGQGSGTQYGVDCFLLLYCQESHLHHMLMQFRTGSGKQDNLFAGSLSTSL